jgi:ribosomal protein L11 methyltransferase
MNAEWLEISTTVERAAAESAEAALFGAGALSVTFRDAGDAPVLEPAPGETPLWPELVVTGLFDRGTDPLLLRAALQAMFPEADWLSSPLPERAWEREWLKDFRPMRFGTRLVVVPGGLPTPRDAVIVRLDPGLAFGTGTHPTTALCLEWLDALAAPASGGPAPLAGARILDHGCGSGILAIAALKLGAAAAVGVDLDPQALLATRANAAANDVAEALVACMPGELENVLGGRQVDVLVANILAGPLQELLPEFALRLRPGGMLALSGILVSQREMLAASAASHFELDPPATRDDWARVSGRRKSAS